MKKPANPARVELAPGVQLLRDGGLEVHQVTPDRTLRLDAAVKASNQKDKE